MVFRHFEKAKYYMKTKIAVLQHIFFYHLKPYTFNKVIKIIEIP
jgi:hypothetical protein